MLTPSPVARPQRHVNLTVSAPRYQVGFARTADDVRAVVDFRRSVLSSGIPASDFYDAHCAHLRVRGLHEDRIVAALRILTPQAAHQVGNYYAENCFFLTHLLPVRNRLVEASALCLDAEHNNGSVVSLMLLKLVELMGRNACSYLLANLALPLADGGRLAANLYAQIGQSYLAPEEFRITPHAALPIERLTSDEVADVPSLLKGLIRAGAWVGGEPGWNYDRGSIDLPLLLPMSRLAPHYLGRLLQSKVDA
jgi:putative hemolysin